MAANPEWYYSKDNQQFGPITTAELKVLAFSGQISPRDFIWNEQWPDWRAAGTIKGFFPKPASPVPPPLPKSQTAAPLPIKPSRNSVSEPSSESAATVAIWNPFAVRAWSLLFTPAIGAYLMMMNWKTLGDEVRAKRSMLWFYGFLAFLILTIITPETPSVTGVFRFIGCVIFVVWACTDAERQVRFVKEKFGSNFVRRSWWKPVGIWIGAVCMILMIHGLIELSSESGNAPSVQKLLKKAEDERIVPSVSSDKTRSLIANRNAESARTASESSNRGSSPSVPTVTPAASAKKDSTKSDEKKDLSVDFANLDIGKIDYSMGPHGELIEKRETYGGLTRFYRGRDGNEYLHGEQIVGPSPSVIEKYAFGMKVYSFFPMSLDNTMCSEMWLLGGGREKLIEWLDKRRGIKLHEDHRLNGKLHGWEMWWDDNGKLTSKNRYENGEIVERSKEP